MRVRYGYGNIGFTGIAIVVSVLFSVLSCRRDDPGQLPDKPVGRVVIAYLCGDNNLSSEVGIKIGALCDGMKQAGAVDGRLVVYADSRDALPRLEEITAAGTVPVETLAEINSASPVNLKRTLQRIVLDFPAEGYGLICFSHASGWLPKGALNDPAGFTESQAATGDGTRTIFEDRGGEMPVADFATALDVLPDGAKFDFILFETCYMAGVEVAYELKERTRYILASSAEMLSDGFAEVYPANLGMLFEPEPALEALARSHFELWNAKTGPWKSATVSLINTAYIDELARRMREITGGDPGWAAGIDIASLQRFNRNPHRLFFDLGQAVEKAAGPEQLAAFNETLAKTIEYKAATPNFMSGAAYSFAIDRHSGLTTYIVQEAFPILNASYAQTGWYGRLDSE